jgi:aminotransferase
MLNFPTNPTGGTMTREELEQVADVVRRHRLLVITDEIYSELTFDGTHTSLVGLPGMADRTIFLHGFSKAYAMTGFRLGYACGPPDLIEAMMRIHQYAMLCASIISQEAAIEALEHGDPDIVAMRDQYALRRNYIRQGPERHGIALPLASRLFLCLPVHPRHRPQLQGIRPSAAAR